MSVVSVPLILDHEFNIQMKLISGIEGIPNVGGALNLKNGLQFLAEKMRDFEIQTFEDQKNDDSKLLKYSSKIFDPLITCIAHWYAVSLLNYLRFIALIRYSENNHLIDQDLINPVHIEAIKKACDEYSNVLAPSVVLWRNKVGAHFSATDAITGRRDTNKNDDLSMLSASLHGKPIWIDGHYFMGSDNTHPLHNWSVTKIHEGLAFRLWPEFNLRQMQNP